MKPRKLEKHDPYFSAIPWEIFYNKGKVIGVVYKPPSSYLNDGLIRRGKRK